MPYYFFDTDDGEIFVVVDEGFDLPSLEAASVEAFAALPGMARDKPMDGKQRNLTVRVRDEAGTVVYSASLSLVGQWHVTPPR